MGYTTMSGFDASLDTDVSVAQIYASNYISSQYSSCP